MTTYSESGVDVDIEEKAAKILYAAAKTSWDNRKGILGEVVTPFDDFSGLRAIDVGGLPKGTVMNVGFDGVGTKAEFAMYAGKFDTLAYDLVAMICDDAVIRGGEPVLIGSILDVNTLGSDETRLGYISQLAEGYLKAANIAQVAIVNGEIAQLGQQVGDMGQFAVNWGASVVWFANKERLITGYDVKPGDTIVALQEASLRSNGISLIRQVLSTSLGPNWHKDKIGDQSILELALAPSTIYSPAIVEMFGGWDMQRAPKAKLSALANVTGGGLPSKLGRALKPSNLGAVIDNPFDPPELMSYCQELGKVNDDEAYRTWHMGQGMVIITPEPDQVMEVATNHHLKSKIIGRVVDEPGITLTSRGFFAKKTALLKF